VGRYVCHFERGPPSDTGPEVCEAPGVDAFPEPGHCSRAIAFEHLISQPLLVLIGAHRDHRLSPGRAGLALVVRVGLAVHSLLILVRSFVRAPLPRGLLLAMTFPLRLDQHFISHPCSCSLFVPSARSNGLDSLARACV
jgi:hypothetical protein